ncbi:MAG: type II toxin-antitoxin system VapC family toxin [Candidatus Wallbacteria bacterium]|nr:type II toxin-antitoxin system VapC family toxin [Candidatus Wallbacteria bacterium]
MSGNYLLDTNAIIDLLKVNSIFSKLEKSAKFSLSFISELELLSYKNIEPLEEKSIRNLIGKAGIIDINDKIKAETIRLRRKYNLKLPDAIICATALSHDLTLITADEKLKNLQEIKSLSLNDICS